MNIPTIRSKPAVSSHLPPAFPDSKLRQTWRFVTGFGELLKEGHRRFGDAFCINLLGYGTLVVLSDEQSIRRIAAGRSEEFSHANNVAAFYVGLNSLVLLEGERHKHGRRRTLSAFSGQHMHRYGAVMKRAADRWVDARTPGETTSAMTGGVEMALEIILVALFGVEHGPQYDRIAGRISTFMRGGHSPFANLLTLLLPATNVRELMLGDRDPYTMEKRPMGLFARLLGVIPTVRAGRGLNDELFAMVKERRRNLDVDHGDGLSHILRTARDEGHAYSDAAAFDEALTLLLAGHDTTAVTLSRALHRVSSAPEVMQAMRDELDAFFPKQPLDPARIDELPYLNAVVQECFRLDSLARGPIRRLEVEMEMGGYKLPVGTKVKGYVYPRQLDPKSWPSADRFCPQQFVGRKPKVHEFAPFGVGFRRCVGAAFALYELKILLAQVVRRVDLKMPEGYEIQEGMLGPLIAALGPVPLEIHRVCPDHEAPTDATAVKTPTDAGAAPAAAGCPMESLA